MELINLSEYVNEQLSFFSRMFISLNWKKEDEYYFYKRVPFLTNEGAKNNDYRYGIGMVLRPALLIYGENDKEVITPWIKCSIEIETYNEETLSLVAKFIKDEMFMAEWGMFKDEDSFKGYFTLEKKMLYSILSFYVNRFYRTGYWENHTI